MTAVPALSSLPGASKSIYLDFDGDFQSVWNRTDSGQQYLNVNVGEFNTDNLAGFSQSELADIHKIWESVAEDYAPFKVNVTTVAPPSFANGAAMRVVIAGVTSAQVRTGPNSLAFVSGNRFITDDGGVTLVDTSGYAALNSFKNSEPNVVYVFAKYMSTWSMTDGEGHPRDFRAMVATTASHEAGHSFGLVHHAGRDAQGNPTQYDVGSFTTTPIMGDNVAGDRTLWSNYTVNGTAHDNLKELTKVFGARRDDFASSYKRSSEFQFSSYNPIRGWSGTVRGAITSTSDSDWFRITSTGNTYRFDATTVEFANLDARLTLYKVEKLPLIGTIYRTIAVSDPQVFPFLPFSGLSAGFTTYLAQGNYAVKVESHGGYGDLGFYNLSVKIPTVGFIDPDWGYASYSSNSGGNGASAAATAPASGGRGTGGMYDDVKRRPPNAVAATDLAFASGQGKVSERPAKKHNDAWSAAADEFFTRMGQEAI